MSDVIYHDIEHAPDTIEVASGDIIRSGPIERGVSRQTIFEPTDADSLVQRAELYRGMAFEADRQCKIEREKNEAIRNLVRAADNELAHFQRVTSGTMPGTVANLIGERAVANARAALTKAKETA